MLSDLATVFAGTQLPVTTIANFFPPVLEKVTIYAPTDANSAEQQAVLTLVSTLARIYAPRPLSIAVVSQQRGAVPPPASGLDRAVVVETGHARSQVENAGTPDAYLRVSGDGDGLSSQVSLLATRLQPLAQSATARVDQAGADAALSGDTLTFSQLESVVRPRSFRTSTLDVAFDRAMLGPRFDSVQVHLLADYTPVPAARRGIRRNSLPATCRLSSPARPIWTPGRDVQPGQPDARPTVRSTWQFALTYTPDQPCGPLVAPMTFQIDPRSTLTMHRGGPPLGGFAAFPSEFSPKFLVALDGSSPNQLSYAARVVAAIARLTSTELTPKVVDLQTAVDATSGALIVANSKAIQQTSLNPPVSGDGSTVNFALPTELQRQHRRRAGIHPGFRRSAT